MKNKEIEVKTHGETIFKMDESTICIHKHLDFKLSDSELTLFTANSDLICHAFTDENGETKAICKDGITISFDGEEMLRDERH